MKKNYVTFFPECEPVHLKKDVGMLPYSIGKCEGFQFQIVCYDNLNFTEEEVNKFHLKFLNKGKSVIKDGLLYIIRNGRTIDILNLYHITSSRNAFWILLYKIVNPRGKVHLKLDADYRMVELFDNNPQSIKGKIRVWIMKNMIDLYTVESNEMKHILEEKWKIKLILLPNGIYRENKLKELYVEEKEKIFLTVGRLGTEQKSTEDLIEAYIKIMNKTDWKLWLVGSLEESFKKYMEQKYNTNPELKDRIIMFGNISDPEKLTQIYRKASCFVLPSKWEGFALVLMEALECGDYLILSDKVPSAEDVGKNGEYASVVPYHDIDALANVMYESTEMKVNDIVLNNRKKWVEENFTWSNIVDKFVVELLEL